MRKAESDFRQGRHAKGRNNVRIKLGLMALIPTTKATSPPNTI
jgi:hypothetical protein